MKKLVLTALLCAAVSQVVVATIFQFDIQGTAGSGLLPGNEPGSITGGTGGEIGAGIFFDDTTTNLTINVGWGSSQGFTDLSSLANNSHIHGPTTGNFGNDGTGNFKQTAGVLVSLTRSTNAVTGGVFTNSPITLTAAQRTDLFNGKFYINIHTVTNGGGELRGFLVPVNPVINQFNLQGTAGPGLLPGNEPGTVTGGTGGEIGAGIFFDDSTSQLTINAGWGSSQGFADLSSLANNSHIHGPTLGNFGNDGTGNFKQTAGVLVSLTRSSNAVTGGVFTDPPITLTAAQRTDLFSGKFYINIHTATNGGGELRGFLVPESPVISQLNLQGTAGPGLLPGNEPGTVTGGTGGEIGAGIFFDHATSQLTINAGWGSSQGFTDLSSLANNSHIHGPTTGNLGNDGTGNFKQTAGVQFSLTRSANAVTGGVFTDPPIILTPAQRTDLFSGKFYINIHTVTNGGGELRGFLVPVYTASVTLIGQTAQIGWFAGAGLNYQVQAASVLESNVWVDLGGQIPGNDVINYYNDPLGTNQSRFYRVMTRP